MSSVPSQPLTSVEKHRRSQLYARLTYAGIIIIFLSVIGVAVAVTMNNERNREGFRPIRLSKPISFIDYTYVDQGKKGH